MSASEPQNAFQKMMHAARHQEKTPSKATGKRSAPKQQSQKLPTPPKKLCLGSPTATAAATAEQRSHYSIQNPCQNQLGSLMAAADLPSAVEQALELAATEPAEPAAAAAGALTQAENQAAVDNPPAQQPQDAAPQEGAAQLQQQHAAAVAAFRNMFGSSQRPVQQKFGHLLVLDLEATCNKQRSLQPIEIIELSSVIVDCQAAAVTNSFQAYVKPTEHPQLDPFCVELTGIQQHQVDAAEQLGPVLARHHEWLQQAGMFGQGSSMVALTWTSWDLAICLPQECAWRKIQRPGYLCSWVDLKQQFAATYKQRGNLRACVEAAGLRWQGRQHSGLDDARNTARLAIKLMYQGVVFAVTQTSENMPVQQQQQLEAGGRGSGSSRGMGGGGGNRGSDRGLQAAAAAAAAGGALVCQCGVKAQLRTTKRPGPNHGRQFFSCGTWTFTRQQSRGCGFCVWADGLDGT